jgi:hypothetical protein
MLQYKCVEGQSLEDVCLQTYGSLDFILKLIKDNGFNNINNIPYSGQIITWDELLTVDQLVNQTATNGGITYATRYLENNPVKSVVSGTQGKRIYGANDAGSPGGAVIPQGSFPTYIGSVDVINPSESAARAMTERYLQKSIQSFVYTIDSKRPCFAFPTFYGAISSIKDTNNFEIISGFAVTNVDFTIAGELVNYTIYTLKRLQTQTNFTITFIP